MTQKNSEPLRGDAAWKAAKQEIAKRNEAAYARGREQRAQQDAARVKRNVALDREEAAMLRAKKPTTAPRAEG
jgi:hypothetical protein